MSRILFAWELGGGLGHIVPYISLLKELQGKGHRIIFVVKDLSRAPLLSNIFRAPCFQAPIKTWLSANPIRTPFTYAHILHNMGFDSLDSLTALVGGWRVLYRTIRPDLVIFDHSPMALMAARGQSFSKVIIGTGFIIPPYIYPLPNLRFWLKPDPERLRNDEDRIIGTINRLLDRLRLPGIKQVTDLFATEPIALRTFKELDPYQERAGGNYFGTWVNPIGRQPVWPKGPGKKLFLYLKPFPVLPSLLASLIDRNVPTIAYVEKVGRRLQAKFDSPSLRFVHAPQDMNRIAKECDVAILNGTHNTSANLLLAGKPALHLPLYLEQYLTTRNIERLGAGVGCPTLKIEDIGAKLEMLLTSDSISEAARAFAARYASMTAGEQTQRLVRFIEDALK
jgi:spore coat polysaccharide biosynthesis predicted glycosyltransferase SpsG